jgi:hypothetical protein
MNYRKITKDEINKITQISPPRERALFTIMRQSGLLPYEIMKLKIGDLPEILEPDPQPPCKINTQYKTPNFIGKEAVRYLKEYLDKRWRKKLTPKNLLFTAKYKPNKPFDKKRASIVFQEKAAKIGKPNELRLYSLIEFFRDNTKEYQKALKELRNNGTPKNDDFYRNLYEKLAMRNLEIEPPRSIDIDEIRRQLRKMQNSFPKKWWEEQEEPTPEEEETMLKEHEEHEKQLTPEQKEEREREYETVYKELKQMEKEADRLHIEYLQGKVNELESKFAELENIIKKILKKVEVKK